MSTTIETEGVEAHRLKVRVASACGRKSGRCQFRRIEAYFELNQLFTELKHHDYMKAAAWGKADVGIGRQENHRGVSDQPLLGAQDGIANGLGLRVFESKGTL